MNINRAREIISGAGYKTQKGIGSEFEFFVTDGKVAITCLVLEPGNFYAVSSHEDIDGAECKDENGILEAVKKAFDYEYEFLANGGKPLRSAW